MLPKSKRGREKLRFRHFPSSESKHPTRRTGWSLGSSELWASVLRAATDTLDTGTTCAHMVSERTSSTQGKRRPGVRRAGSCREGEGAAVAISGLPVGSSVQWPPGHSRASAHSSWRSSESLQHTVTWEQTSVTSELNTDGPARRRPGQQPQPQPQPQVWCGCWRRGEAALACLSIR